MKSNLKFPMLEIIVAVLLFLMLRPSFTWSWNMIPIQYALWILMACLFDFKEKNNILLFLFLFVIISIVPITRNYNIFGIVTFVLSAVFIPFARKDSNLIVFNFFKYLVVVTLAMSIIVWFAIVVFQRQLPYTVIEPLNDLKNYNYISYPFLVVPMQIQNLAIVRFCGIFDEPGVVGTISLLFLYYGDFKLKRLDNIVFLIAGLISFSLFFFLGFNIMLMLKVFLNKKLKKNRMASIVGIALLLVTVLTVPVMNEMVGSRLEFDEDIGTIVGNNRSGNDLNDYISSIRGTDKYYWGDFKRAEDYSNHASLQNAVLNYGVVFMFLFFVFYFFYAKSRLHNIWLEIVMFMLLLFITLYQRPGFLNPTYLFLFSSIVQSRQVQIELIKKKTEIL